MKIEVIYALPERQELVTLDLPEGSTVQQAVEASGLLSKYPDIEPGGKNKLGVFAKLVKPDAVLRERDRAGDAGHAGAEYGYLHLPALSIWNCETEPAG